MEGDAEWQNGELQVHLCGRTDRGQSGATSPQRQAQIDRPGGVEAPQFGGAVHVSAFHIVVTSGCSVFL